MKKIKCILSVLLGFFLGLLSSCGSNDQEKKPPEKDPASGKKEQPEPPKKGEELPVRRPILE